MSDRIDPVLVHAAESAVFHRELDRGYPLIERGEGDVAHRRRRQPLPGRGRRRRDGRLARRRRGRRGRGGRPRSWASSRSSTTSSSRARPRSGWPDELIALAPRVRARPLRERRRRGERDAAAARPRLPRRARRAGALERDLVRAGLPRADHGDARADGAARPPRAVPALPARDHLTSRRRRWRFDPTGEAALAAIRDRDRRARGRDDRGVLLRAGQRRGACPRTGRPTRFWRGLDGAPREHGFLICLDEVVTGMGRTGTLVRRPAAPLQPDIVSTAKGLGAGYAPVGGGAVPRARLRGRRSGSRGFELGHTWDGAPLSCAVGLRGARPARSASGSSSGWRARPGAARRAGRRAGRAARWSPRCAAAASCSASSTPIRADGESFLDPAASASPPRSTRRRSARPDRLLDPADRGRLRRRPDAARAGVQRAPTRSSSRWSSACGRRSPPCTPRRSPGQLGSERQAPAASGCGTRHRIQAIGETTMIVAPTASAPTPADSRP